MYGPKQWILKVCANEDTIWANRGLQCSKHIHVEQALAFICIKPKIFILEDYGHF